MVYVEFYEPGNSEGFPETMIARITETEIETDVPKNTVAMTREEIKAHNAKHEEAHKAAILAYEVKLQSEKEDEGVEL